MHPRNGSEVVGRKIVSEIWKMFVALTLIVLLLPPLLLLIHYPLSSPAPPLPLTGTFIVRFWFYVNIEKSYYKRVRGNFPSQRVYAEYWQLNESWIAIFT